MSSEILVPFDHQLKCPICLVLLDIVVRTEIKSPSARVSGTEGLGYPTSISFSSTEKAIELIIEKHVCPINLKTNY